MSEGARTGGARALAITARTAHIAAMAMLVGGLHFAATPEALRLWQAATGATGLVLLATEVSHSRHWIYQGRGLLTLAHLAAPALLLVGIGPGRAGTVAALVVGSVGSHLPRVVRKWSLRHRCVVD
jgi:hypothetical protein